MDKNIRSRQPDDALWTYEQMPLSPSPTVENSQAHSSLDSQKLVLPGPQSANGELYSDHTLALPMHVQQEIPFTVPATDYSRIAGSTPTAYAFPPVSGAPLRASSRMQAGHRSSLARFLWWFAFIGVVIAIATVVTLFLPSVLAQQNQQGIVATSTTTVQPTPTMVPPTPTPISTTLNGVTITPGQFFLTTDCQPNNGFRCAITLQASFAQQARTFWLATAQPRTSIQFRPDRGVLQPGQQMQLVINVRTKCPYKGSLFFTIKGKHLTVPLYC